MKEMLIAREADHVIYKTAFVWVDGSCVDNPGGSMGVGVHITDFSGKDLYQGGGWIGEGTNNFAEFAAVVSGLLIAEWLGFRYVKVYSDSETCVKAINGEYTLKSPNLLPIAKILKTQLTRFTEWELIKIPRESNTTADALAQGNIKKGKKKDNSFNQWFYGEIRRLKNARG